MVSNIYLLLGVEEGSSLAEIKRAYARLMGSLDTELRTTSERRPEVGAAIERLSTAFESLKEPSIRKTYESWSHEKAWADLEPSEAPPEPEEYCRPKLGQLLVASGLLTLEELDACLEIQRNTHHTHIPIGQLLVGAGYLTPEQLDYYLRVQQLTRLPSDHPRHWGQRLVELGLVSEDQLKVALIEQKTTGCTLRQALINRGWLTAELLDRIF